MDGAQGAFLPLAAAFRLSGLEARRELYHVVEQWVKIPAEELGGRPNLRREGGSGLPQHQKPARSGFAEGWSIYPPYPIGVPIIGSRGLSGWLVMREGILRLVWLSLCLECP